MSAAAVEILWFVIDVLVLGVVTWLAAMMASAFLAWLKAGAEHARVKTREGMWGLLVFMLILTAIARYTAKDDAPEPIPAYCVPAPAAE